MKIETKEVITVEVTARLTIEEARTLNTTVAKVFSTLESCSSISRGDLKSYRRDYSQEAIDYQKKSNRDEAERLEFALYLLIRFGSIDMALDETKEIDSEMRTAYPDFIPQVYCFKELAKTEEYKKWTEEGQPLIEVKEEDMSEEDQKTLKQNTKAIELLTKLKDSNVTDFYVIYK